MGNAAGGADAFRQGLQAVVASIIRIRERLAVGTGLTRHLAGGGVLDVATGQDAIGVFDFFQTGAGADGLAGVVGVIPIRCVIINIGAWAVHKDS